MLHDGKSFLALGFACLSERLNGVWWQSGRTVADELAAPASAILSIYQRYDYSARVELHDTTILGAVGVADAERGDRLPGGRARSTGCITLLTQSVWLTESESTVWQLAGNFIIYFWNFLLNNTVPTHVFLLITAAKQNVIWCQYFRNLNLNRNSFSQFQLCVAQMVYYKTLKLNVHVCRVVKHYFTVKCIAKL
jgi:hypothetical protein